MAKRIYLLTTALGVVICVFVGCSKSQETAPGSTAVAPSPAGTSRPTESQSAGGVELPPVAAESPSADINKEARNQSVLPQETTKADSQKAQALMGEADALQAQSSYAKASELYEQAMEADPSNLELPFKSACNYGHWGKSEEAIESLGVAADMGYADAQAVTSSDAFSGVRENPRYQKILSQIEKN